MSKTHDPIPPRIRRGLQLFDDGEFFEAHEILEEEWVEERRPIRLLYQGLIQASVAFYHHERGNEPGKQKMIAAAVPKLEPYAPSWNDVPIDRLLSGLRTLAARDDASSRPRLSNL